MAEPAATAARAGHSPTRLRRQPLTPSGPRPGSGRPCHASCLLTASGFYPMPAKRQHGKESRRCGQRTGGLHMLKRVQAIGYPSWVGSIGLAIAVAITYFLAARLSLALLTEPDGVAVFWPAAGIASGLLIALGPGARLPVAVGVMAATVTANLLGDRNVGSAIVFALCNAGEAMIIAWLIEYHFGSVFSLDSSRRVLGLFLATAVGTAISGHRWDGGVHPVPQLGCADPDHLAELGCFRRYRRRHGCAAGYWACPHPARSA